MKAGWKKESLGDLCEFQRGLTYAKSDEVDVSDNVVLRATNVDLTTNLLDFSDLKYLNKSVIVPESKKVKKGSLIICTASGSKSHLGKVAYIDDDYGYAFGGFMGMISPRTELVPKYLFHLMTSDAYKHFIEDLADGMNINNLKFDDLREFPVPYPTTDEQWRIVGILDKAFDGIAAAKANAEENIQNARSLFDSRVQLLFTQSGEGWVEKPLGELAKFRNGINYTKNSNGERVKIVGVRNFQNHFLAPLDDLDTVTIDGELRELEMLRRDDILAVRSNGNIELIGRCILVGEVTERISYSGFTIRIRLTNGRVLPKYVCHFMKSFGARKLLTEGGTGTNIKSLNQGMLSALVIPFPPINAQKILVEKIDSLSSETRRLAHLYERKLAALEALKKSMLHQAFTGNP